MRWRTPLPLLLLSPLALAAGPFNLSDGASGVGVLAPDPRGQEAPDRSFDVQKLNLSIDLDPEARAVSGVATYTVQRLGPGPLSLDQVEMSFGSVLLDGAPAQHRAVGDALLIEIPTERGAVSSVEIHFSATPRNGLHFRGESPDSFPHVFSQGEDEENRYWFPSWDHPNDRFVYTGQVKAPPGWKAMTNPTDDLVTYLIMLAAGPYEEHGSGDNTVWVPPGTSPGAISRVLDPIPAMKAHFAKRTGVEYPWGNYRQIFVERFIYLGMENTGATIEDARMLIPDERSGSGRWVEGTVAHELAHQWFGDLLTCRSWRELWLNEGFATFMATDWARETRGEDIAAAEMRGYFAASLDGPALAGRFHQGPGAPDNGRVYVKGASVLHMLRVMLGEDAFWAGVRRYTRENQRGLVDSEDLRDALERESGQELGWFFQQWVELPVVPELTVRSRWEDGKLVVTVRQAVGPKRPAYTLPITVEIGTAEGPQRISGWLDDEELELSQPLPAAPLYVAFDPDSGVLARVEQQQEPSAWEAQLASPSPHARLAAAEALGDTDASAALIATLSDAARPTALRVAAARALGEQRMAEPLLRQISTPDADLRAQVVEALGRTTGAEVAAALRKGLSGEPLPHVREGMLASLSKVDPGLSVIEARKLIRIRGREWEGLRHAAADALGEHGTANDLGLLLDPKLSFIVRPAPLHAAVRLAARSFEGQALLDANARIARVAEPLLDDLDLRTRQNVLPVLAEVGDTTTVAKLERYRREEEARKLIASARDAIATIEGRVALPVVGNDQDVRLEALEKRIKQLEEEMDSWRERH